MRIAQISPLYESVPPGLYGGTERVVSYLTEALVQAGHQVTLFASGDSSTSARLVPVRSRALRLDPSPLNSSVSAHLAMLDEVRQRADEFDILHFHTDLLHFPFFENLAHRTLTTLHGRLDMLDLSESFARWRQFPLVSISNAQRSPLPWANWMHTVYHGLPANLYRPAAAPRGDYAVFLGRIAPEKRPDRAIEIARRAGMPLRIAAKVDAADQAYFRACIQPLLQDEGVEYLGEVNDQEKAELLGNASALLFPIDWPEPFGLVMIEALACGTPVIGWRCGSVPEIIQEGSSGHIVDSVHAGTSALLKIASLDRNRVRQEFDTRFTSIRMADAYVSLYERLLARSVIRDSLPSLPASSHQLADSAVS